ncbi:cell surface protein [Haloferula sp. A504]|uniref:cell surface protein n=1 Tax=Haloferula sp. A504 TaxID=3373601 RepID=UPI0031BCD807|nr:hypothetical protein [Verrucomicrobiaceae bacterium E54]
MALIHPGIHEVTQRIALQGTPKGLAWDPRSGRLMVAEFGAGQVAEIDPESAEVVRRLPVGRYPHGLAVAPERRLLLVGDWGLGELRIIDLGEDGKTTRIPVDRQPTGVAVSADESFAVVSHLVPNTAATVPDHAAAVAIIDLESMEKTATVRLPTGSTNVQDACIGADGATAYVVHTIGRFHLPTTQLDRGWVNTNALSVIDLAKGSRRATVLLDQVMDGAADPWGVTAGPAGKRLYVTLAGVHQLAVIDLDRLSKLIASSPASLSEDLSALHRENVMRRIDLPAKGPRGISVSAAGDRLAMAGYFTGNVILTDPDGDGATSIPLAPPQEPDAARRGEIAFHDANRCFQRWLSCASCHPDARSDGLNWDLLNDGIGNPKNARSMVFSHLTPPVMSLGVRDQTATAVRAGFVHIQFTEPEPGEVESVMAYLQSIEPLPSPYREPDGSLSEAATRGKKIFNRRSVGCASCHPEPLFTKLEMEDVGTTGSLDQGAALFDTPSLRELWRTPPYLHDGRAATVREVLTDHNLDDLHGTTSALTEREIDDLVAYLLSI